MAKSTKPIPFEKALDELAALVDAMEEGHLSLEDSLKAFETGIKLTRECQKALSEAEQKVQLLLQENGQENGQLRLQPLPELDGDDGDDA